MSLATTTSEKIADAEPNTPTVVDIKSSEDAEASFVQGNIDFHMFESALEIILESNKDEKISVVIDEFNITYLATEDPPTTEGEVVFEEGNVILREQESGTRYAYRTPPETKKIEFECPDCGKVVLCDAESDSEVVACACVDCGFAMCR